ncbi:MAG TPA: GspE/PulE family protein [Pirellulales bacterium]|jgi:type IV pilus assembly protein PilB|nr:GspE/PulE family protein [Pirellulales bacterium]
MSETNGKLLDMDRVRIDPAWALRVPPSLALRRQVLPIAAVDGQIYVACADETDLQTLQAVQRHFDMPICPQRAEPLSLKRSLGRIFGDLKSAAAGAAIARGRTSETDLKDATGLCDELLHAAVVREASDVHIDPHEDGVQIRFRVDGQLEKYRKLSSVLHNGLVSRFKVLAGMDIAEKRAPQDGQFRHRYGPTNQTVDIRVATLPTAHGERMTLRLLALQTESLTLERLGMLAGDLAQFESAINKPHGLILLTGPTGSGKSTTLYAAIRRLMSLDDLNIVTIEDPIEYGIPGVAQVEVDSADKVSFGKALRSVLRHDPDVVMIGEIRDRETADVAIKASLTGHLVLSTLHTNSAASVITRMTDMGIDRYLTAATLRLAVAQRLVRRMCEHCRTPRPMTVAEAIAFDRPDAAGTTVYEPKGCLYCANRGYIGRLGLFELLPCDENVARDIARDAKEAEIVAYSRAQGMPRLIDDGFEKVTAGLTSIKEAMSAVTVW